MAFTTYDCSIFSMLYMRYQILNPDADLSLIKRLLKVRNVSDAPQDFLNPSIANYRLDPFLLKDMEK